jgi:SAM-dependent methyltransferase
MSYDKTYEHLLLAYEAPGSFEFLVENKSGVIAVLPDKTVIGGGAYDGRFNTDPVRDTNGIFRAYALSALHARPTDVLMIGLSSGSWAQVIVNNPEVSHLDIVEINPGYLSMIPRYVEVRSVLSNTKVTINIDDGRRWLRRHPGAKFDAIVMNTTWHWRANVTNLLSTEFLELIRQHLKPGGVFYYNTTDSPEAQITGATVFPYLVRISNFVAVSDTPITVSKQRWLETMHEYMIDGRRVLDPKNGVANQVLLDKYAGWVDHANGNSAAQMIEYGDTIRARYKGRTVITDDNMACEWRE